MLRYVRRRIFCVTSDKRLNAINTENRPNNNNNSTYQLYILMMFHIVHWARTTPVQSHGSNIVMPLTRANRKLYTHLLLLLLVVNIQNKTIYISRRRVSSNHWFFFSFLCFMLFVCRKPTRNCFVNVSSLNMLRSTVSTDSYLLNLFTNLLVVDTVQQPWSVDIELKDNCRK